MSDCDGSPSTSSSSSRRFSLADIKSATDNFADELVIGRGGFGKVYKGSITDGETMTVAVKRLNPLSRQGAREFRTEIEMLSRFQYWYIVSLIGYCDEPDEMILVYEYMPRGNFADHLHRSGKNYSAPLPWLRRLRICIDAARGLDYLHTGTSIQPDRAIHRDVKSSNILLDDNWDAKISDFGLSKLGPEDQAYSHVSTEVKGTFGYLDPEYYLTRRLTRKSDVYAFGVVMLEALCGRPAVDLSGDEEQCGLAGWAQYCIGEGTVDKIIDPSVKEEIKKDCLMEFVQIAVECLHNFPRKRPTMAEIVVRLELALAMQEGKDSSKIVKPVKLDLALQEGEHSSDVVKPAKMTFTRKVQRYFLGTTSVNSDTKPTSKVQRNYSSISNSTLPDKDGAMSNNKDRVLAQELPSGGQTLIPRFKQFTFSELESITKNFNRERVLGKKLNLVAYKGWIDEKTYNPSGVGVGMAVVVKEISLFKQFIDLELIEIFEFLRKCSHPNLVKLLGYCTRGNTFTDFKTFLVHEDIQMESLDNHLFRKGSEPLSWPIRLKIAIGAAQGLAFLHTVEKQSMYSKFEASDILLDKDFNAKLSDFGIQELDGTGDPSYGPEEYAPWAKPPSFTRDFRDEVYDFGVVLLQILACRREVGEYWAITYFSTPEKVKSALMGMELQQRFPLRAAQRVAVLVLRCLDREPKSRPSMEEVLLNLQTIEKQTPSRRTPRSKASSSKPVLGVL
ncbi:hypothetical protein RJ640_029777 [Escallonia rubra]|uniref:Protein kinase domain-containing protein n=1 Tax=Escallonia rubra TaxID=112253 RepID=A0AA88U426_9ASTE|nr:hypothetical protein RJ640_029777 [Escallonia rubra]